MKYISLLLVSLSIILASGSGAVAQQEQQSDDNRLTIPMLTLGLSGGGIVRERSVGFFGNGNFQFNAHWAYLAGDLTVAPLANSANGPLFTEITGYGHLLAIGVSDITYRRYLDGDEIRAFPGFSFTRSHEGFIRVDVNLGVDYFSETFKEFKKEEWGMQVGARVLARFWRIENLLQFSVYQNLSVGTGSLSLEGTEIVCANFEEVLAGGDLMCVVPEEEPDEGSDGGLVNWQTTGFLIRERLFMNLVDLSNQGRAGLEAEVRLEKTPLRGFNFWVSLGVRYYWSTMNI